MSEEPQSVSVVPPGPGARCAIHPDVPAEATCTRCGNFTCSSCIDVQSTGLCLACRARTGHSGPFPYSRDHWSLDGLISLSIARYKQHWLVLVPFCGVGLIVLYAISFAGAYALGKLSLGSTTAGSVLNIVRQVGLQVAMNALQLVFELSSFGLCLDALEGRPVSVTAALARLRRFPSALLVLLVSLSLLGAFIGVVGGVIWLGGKQRLWIAGLTAVVGLPVGVYLMLGLAFAQIGLVSDPRATALEALRGSWSMVSGQRWAVFGVGLVAGILACAGVLGCCVGIIGTLPLGLLLYGALYLALKTPTTTDHAELQRLANPQWRV